MSLHESVRLLSSEDAFKFLEEGALSSGKPVIEDFARILHNCRRQRNHSQGLQLHARMCEYGVEVHHLLGNLLVPLLVETGHISDAQQLFDRLPYRKESSWTSLIMGYLRCGQANLAFKLYQKMCEEDDFAFPSSETVVALLKACAKLKNLEIGLTIHDRIVRKDCIVKDVVIGTALMDMYSKCGCLVEAQQVFDKLPMKDVVSWTALITGYAQNGHSKEALKYFDQMQHEGILPNAITFVSSLKACASIGAIEKGQEIHYEVARRGLLGQDIVVGTTLVDMYAKCGSLRKAKDVFDNLPMKNVVSWNALMTGYVQHGYGKEALVCLEQMYSEGVSLDVGTYVCALKACGTIGSIEKGKEIHVEIFRKGLQSHTHVASALVDMYAKCGLLAKAQELFDKFSLRDVVSWTALITGYIQHGHANDALNCYEQMKLEGISPNSITYTCCLKACGSVGAIDKGREVHGEIAKRGLLVGNLLIGTTLVDMYAKCGWLVKAQEVFDMLPVRNTVSWNALIAGYVQHGFGDKALNCFELMCLEGISPDAVTFVCILKACASIGATDQGQEIHTEVLRKGLLETDVVVGTALVDMYARCGLLTKAQDVFHKLQTRNAVSWNAMIGGYALCGHADEALNCLEKMRQQGFSPDAITFVCSLRACADLGAKDKGHDVHAEITQKGFEKQVVVANALVDMYAKCGLLAQAQDVFDRLSAQDSVSWTTLIAGYAQLGETEKVFSTFDVMIGEGMQPTAGTFLSVLNACSHTGSVEKGQMFFMAMIRAYGLVPALQHHTCMVDLLCRAGQLDKSIAIVKEMPICADFVVLHTLLSACRKWGTVELGRQLFDCAIQMDSKNSAAYVCMSNISLEADIPEDCDKFDVWQMPLYRT